MILNGMEFNIFQQKIGKYPNPLSAKFLNIQRILTKTNETLQKKHRPRRKKNAWERIIFGYILKMINHIPLRM